MWKPKISLEYHQVFLGKLSCEGKLFLTHHTKKKARSVESELKQKIKTLKVTFTEEHLEGTSRKLKLELN